MKIQYNTRIKLSDILKNQRTTSTRVYFAYVQRVRNLKSLLRICIDYFSSYVKVVVVYVYSKQHYASNDVPLKILWHLMYCAFRRSPS